MREIMSIDEMREKKVAAEKAMTEILNKFESETGLCVSEIFKKSEWVEGSNLLTDRIISQVHMNVMIEL